LAAGFCEITQLTMDTTSIQRIRRTVSQTGLSMDERQENVHGVFEVVRPELIDGTKVVIVDDVLTTGATVSSMGKALIEAGAIHIGIAALAFTRPA
jgi:predicted amidophosphoribosyltransferase